MNSSTPLAERMRPATLDEYVGQQHLVGQGAILRNMIESGKIASFILWGPPGVGKTTLAKIIANAVKAPFYTLSAVHSGVKEVREVIERCKTDLRSMFSGGQRPILFIDEIHRFNKSQQDSLLAAVENGTVTLIGATTENPSFEVIRPLLSRAQVYTLEPLTDDDLNQLLHRAIENDEILASHGVKIESTSALFRFAGGDARKLLNILDLLEQSTMPDDEILITDDVVTKDLQRNPMAYDKNGEMHYDIISAFIKSMRGSHPDAAVYWLARMIEGGEDPEFIARRMVVFAAEDVGLANPNALLLANATFDIIHKIGWPEARIPLSECAIYLATSAKSNSGYLAIDAALDYVRRTGNLPVPLHLRNAPTKMMKDMGYGHNYLYPHNYPAHFVNQQYLPDNAAGAKFWIPADNPSEQRAATLQDERWNKKI